MNCFECALKGQEVPAVATCRHCGAAMCLEHVALAQRHQAGGTTFDCPHDLSKAER